MKTDNETENTEMCMSLTFLISSHQASLKRMFVVYDWDSNAYGNNNIFATIVKYNSTETEPETSLFHFSQKLNTAKLKPTIPCFLPRRHENLPTAKCLNSTTNW